MTVSTRASRSPSPASRTARAASFADSSSPVYRASCRLPRSGQGTCRSGVAPPPPQQERVGRRQGDQAAAGWVGVCRQAQQHGQRGDGAPRRGGQCGWLVEPRNGGLLIGAATPLYNTRLQPSGYYFWALSEDGERVLALETGTEHDAPNLSVVVNWLGLIH